MKCYLLFHNVFDGHNLRINEGTKTILNPETHATLITRHRTHISKTQPQKIQQRKLKKISHQNRG
jgi:hypothetical protein